MSSPRTGRSSRRLLRIAIPLVLLALLALIVVGFFETRSFLDRRQPHLPPTDPKTAFRIVYHVEDTSGEPVVVRTEIVEVRRPYDSRVEVHLGSSPEGRLQSGRVTNREHFWNIGSDGEVNLAYRRSPDGGGRQVSLEALRDAVRAGVAERLGRESLLGRACNMFGFARPAPQALAAPLDDEYVELCVTPDGLPLIETWTFREKKAREARAVSISTSAAPQTRFLVGEEPPKTEAGEFVGGSIIVRDEIPPRIVADFSPPKDFRVDRRAVVTYVSLQEEPRQSFVETYLRNDAVVVVERGTVPGGRVPWEPGQGRPAARGPLGAGRFVYFVDRVELRFFGDWGFARVAAPSAELGLRFSEGLALATAPPSN